MKQYKSEQWQEILAFNDLDTYEKIWALKAEWFEEPNERRGGWSGVSRIELKLPSGGCVGAFLKRQENHVTSSISHPIRGLATFSVEFANISNFKKNNIPTLETIFFAHWHSQGAQRAVLITEELAEYLPLSSAEYRPGGIYVSTKEQKLSLFKQLSALIKDMHAKGFKHDCLYLKHVFAKQLPSGKVDLRLIDLEKVKKTPFKKGMVFRDLYSLHRHSDYWGVKDKLTFFKYYQQESRLSKRSRVLIRKIEARIVLKNK